MPDLKPNPGPLSLLPEGVHAAGQSEAPGSPELQACHWNPKVLLGEQLSETHSFFSPALLYLYLPLGGRDPYRDYCAANGCTELPLFLEFPMALFDPFPPGINQELGDPAASLPWRNCLLALTHETFRRFREWVGRLTILDHDRQAMYRVCYQKLYLTDPVFWLKATVLPANLPMIELWTFTFWDDQHRCYFKIKTKTPWRPTPAVFEPQQPDDHRLLKEALLTEHDNPYAYVETEASGRDEASRLYDRAIALHQQFKHQTGPIVGKEPNTRIYDPRTRTFQNGSE